MELPRASSQRFELRAVCDLDQTLAGHVANGAVAELGKRPHVFGDYRALLETGDIDAVTAIVHQHLYHFMARDALAAGVYISTYYGLRRRRLDQQVMTLLAAHDD